MSGWVAIELRRRLNIPVVQIFHAMGKTKRRHQQKVDSSPGDRIETEKDVIREVDRIIAQCPSERCELVEDYGANPDKIALIPSAVNTEIFKPVARDAARRRIGLDANDKIIVYVGRLLPRKERVWNLIQKQLLRLVSCRNWRQSLVSQNMFQPVEQLYCRVYKRRKTPKISLIWCQFEVF
jgi:glycosyltransferase involved in cell wall biosynthesis